MVPVTVFDAAGEDYLFFSGLGTAPELALLALVVRSAWTWPRAATTPGPEAVLDRQHA